MWADNEADLDLLGFDYLVDGLVVALTEPRLLPLTVGVLGDWGSGKSSLMTLAGNEVAAELSKTDVEGQEPKPKYLVVEFSPWQHEDYDDVKVALMTAILDSLHENAPELAAEIGRARKFIDRLKRIGRRSGRLGATIAADATPIVLQLVAPDLDPGAAQIAAIAATTAAAEAKGALADPPPQTSDEDNDVEVPNDIKAFRTLFGGLVEAAPYEAVVVLIDDLDRCLPETVVDTFEAIRLFLNTPRTAYVLALNQTVVESAIDSRYPDLKKDDGAGIGRDYLEKMLQLKVAIPPLSAPEAETYINLLFAELHLEGGDFDKAREAAEKIRATGDLRVAFNLGIATDALGAVPEALVRDLTWAAEVTPVLGTSLRGNPRQLKRFLNNLLLKYRSAARRKIDLELPILAKLMVLEDQYKSDFQKLFDWEMAASGKSPEMSEAEDHARSSSAPAPTPVAAKKSTSSATATTTPAKSTQASPPAPTDAQTWANKTHIADWLRIEPPLKGVDLRKYFTYSRDKLSFGVSASRLTPALQTLLIGAQSDVDAMRRSFHPAVKGLDSTERAQLVEALLDRAQRNPSGIAFRAALELGEQNSDVVQQICDALKRISPAVIPPQMATAVPRRLPADHPDVMALLDSWEASGTPALKAAVASARKAGQ